MGRCIPWLLLCLLLAPGIQAEKDVKPKGAAKSVVPSQPLAAASRAPRRIEVRWRPVKNATRYVLHRKLGEKGAWKRVDEFERGVTRFVDKALLPRSVASYKLEYFAPDRGELAPVGPVEALDDFYLELRAVKRGTATVYVHKWNPAMEAWLRSSEPFKVRVGKPIGGEDMLADFTTGAKLLKIGSLPADASVQFIRYRTQDLRLLTVTTRDEVPAAVWVDPKKKKKKKKKQTASKKSSRQKSKAGPKVRTGIGPRVLKFPQPRVVGKVRGKRIVWEIVNRSKLRMSFVVWGRKSKHDFKVEPDKTYVVKLRRGGTYQVTCNASDNKILPMKGKFGLLEGTKYRTEFGIRDVKPKR